MGDSHGKDVALVTGPTEDAKGARIVRLKDDQLSFGEVRALEEGKPINGEVLKLTPRKEHPNVCDIDVVMEAPKHVLRDGKGPAKVASESYRANWDKVFGAN